MSLPALSHAEQQEAVEKIHQLMAQGLSSGQAIAQVAAEIREAKQGQTVPVMFDDEDDDDSAVSEADSDTDHDDDDDADDGYDENDHDVDEDDDTRQDDDRYDVDPHAPRRRSKQNDENRHYDEYDSDNDNDNDDQYY